MENKELDEIIDKCSESFRDFELDRFEYNIKCLDKLKELVAKYPNWRFMQLLYNIGLCEDRFYEESKVTFDKIKDSYDAESL